MSKIQLIPLDLDEDGVKDAGQPIQIPAQTHGQVIGRGQFLQIVDKKVSRNHATLDIEDDGCLVLTPIHNNPCFYQEKGEGEKKILQKSVPQILKDKDIFSLLPDKLFYRVEYKSETVDNNDPDDETDGEMSVDENESKPKAKPKETKQINGKKDDSEKNCKSENERTVEVNHEDNNDNVQTKMALPLDKERKLPKWMVGSAKRVGMNVEQSVKPAKRAAPTPKAKSPTKSPGTGRGRGRPKQSKKDDYSDEEDEVPVKKKTPVKRKVSAVKEESETVERRLPRAASIKKPQYQDNYVESDEPVSSDESSDAGWKSLKTKKKNYDSDFSISDDSGSDWEQNNKDKKYKPSPVKSRSNSRGGGRGRPKKGKMRDYDSDEFSGFSDDEYVPRPSSSRGGGERRRGRAQDDSDDDEDYGTPKRGRNAKTASPKKRRAPAKRGPKKRKKSETDDSEEEEKPKVKRTASKKTVDKSDESDDVESNEEPIPQPKTVKKNESDEEGGKEKREACIYGKKCYRKNPAHAKQYSHPGDSDYDEESDGIGRDKGKTTDNSKAPVKKAGRPAREKDKKSVLHGASDDEGEANTYDYDDSFMDDSTLKTKDESGSSNSGDSDSSFEVEGSQDVRDLAKEAKSFIKSPKMQKPARTK